MARQSADLVWSNFSLRSGESGQGFFLRIGWGAAKSALFGEAVKYVTQPKSIRELDNAGSIGNGTPLVHGCAGFQQSYDSPLAALGYTPTRFLLDPSSWRWTLKQWVCVAALTICGHSSNNTISILLSTLNALSSQIFCWCISQRREWAAIWVMKTGAAKKGRVEFDLHWNAPAESLIYYYRCHFCPQSQF